MASNFTFLIFTSFYHSMCERYREKKLPCFRELCFIFFLVLWVTDIAQEIRRSGDQEIRRSGNQVALSWKASDSSGLNAKMFSRNMSVRFR